VAVADRILIKKIKMRRRSEQEVPFSLG